jgi:chromosome segregation protein
MIQFARLRLHGFKSFVDRTELDIGPGLTGIVGPNGCGKSNLVEALKWIMGESSAKKMRGGTGSMDDVIFNGTEKRPARNMAEVSLLMDNTSRSAPSPWNVSDEIEIVRKIEREHGSSFRITGKSVRARDVAMLFADVAAGANSPYLVSQGRVTALINAKPSERRMILEEAAGITGLYARRHEAELRLRATDNNLKRLEDIVGSMDSRLQSLKKQARQAGKYRNLSAQIRQLEVMIACIEWRNAFHSLRDVERKFDEIEAQVAERLTVVTQLNRTQNTQSADLPDLRREDAENSAALQAQKLTLQRLEDEESRLETQLKDTKDGLAKLVTDRQHEQQTLEENTGALERMDTEEKTLQSSHGNDDAVLKDREDARQNLQKSVAALESEQADLTQAIATDRAQKASLEQKLEQDQRRHDTVARRLSDVQASLSQKRQAQSQDDPSPRLRTEIETAETKAEKLRAEVIALETSVASGRKAIDSSRLALTEADRQKSKLDSEIAALQSVLESYTQKGFKPVLDQMRADEGFEVALSRALGETLMGSLDENAPVTWRQPDLDPANLPALPEGAASIEPHVKSPAPVRLALSQIGTVADDAMGERLSKALKPGQSLVSLSGAYWRWDGLHVKAVAADRNAVQLKQKNKLAELEKQLPNAVKAAETAKQTHSDNEKAAQTTQIDLGKRRTELQDTERAVRDNRIALNRAVESQSARNAELAKLEEALSLAENDLKDLNGQIIENRKSLEAFDEKKLQDRQSRMDSVRARLSAEREKLHEAIREFEAHRQEHSRRKARLQAIGDERVNLTNRCIRARERLKDLDGREKDLKQKHEDLKSRPGEIRKAYDELLTKTSELERKKSAVADRLAAVEAALAETTKGLKQAESELSAARETRAHAQATAGERQRQLEDIRRHINEHFDMTPENLSAQAALDPENLPALDAMRQQREQAVRERDQIGPVNLQADIEADALEKELGTILNERNDLSEAINELRNGINKLNKEARERLSAAFDHVNDHFRAMFTKLFNGGKAHLALIDSEDPLEAGLEIFAQPPGKALQSLSLLSGGEQTLTAVALIFAMFLTNPAPICVLDEVDAPLDDANVDRFCDMLEEFAERGQTRFLVITHHRLTMARMDRLYGVTMSERGVSQLVSVDMNQQLDFLEAAE